MKRFKWVVEIDVAETWVADGFDLTPERLEDILGKVLNYANGSEYSGRVIARPRDSEVAAAMGYRTIEAYRDHAGELTGRQIKVVVDPE